MGASIGLIVVAVLALIIALKVAKLLLKAVFIVIAVALAVGAWQASAKAAPTGPPGAYAASSVSA